MHEGVVRKTRKRVVEVIVLAAIGMVVARLEHAHPAFDIDFHYHRTVPAHHTRDGSAHEGGSH
jgi:hypothetical protein